MTATQIDSLRALIDKSKQIVLFTGAGISTESGISDYRSKGGLWKRFQPVTIQEFIADPEKRRDYWTQKRELFGQIRDARPNPAHEAGARLEAAGKLLGVITQNIDGLHKLAGCTRVLEIHGTNRETICLDCGKIDPFEEVYERLLAGDPEPHCAICSGLLKPNTISFGQNLVPEVIEQAFKWAEYCDLMIAAGSTLVVEPAASLPRTAARKGTPFVIINNEPTPLDALASLVLRASTGQILEQVFA